MIGSRWRTRSRCGMGTKMELLTEPRQVGSLEPEQLRQYMATHHEREYLLIDVRQPAEFEAGHIPGSKSMPLAELDLQIADIAKFENKNLIFYCRSGRRSARACEYAAKIIGFPHVFDLTGGFVAWSGAKLTGLPPLRALDVSGSVEQILWQALELEKGAHRLYAALVPHFRGTAAADVIEELARAEVAHSRTLYDLLGTVAGKPEQDFDAMFHALRGDLVEGGESYEQLVARAEAMGGEGSLALLELALEIELRAHDLYKNLADAAATAESQTLLDELAQHEKRHAEALFRKLERLASH
jgi:sulfur-carrier protein adenylyltransferase/sulfurtransferase